ncbi:hypothetical protein TNCV_3409811 [Trichonephila clavipes]|nr:hypothetical protein TNCV_3409811 [Trichonephila clavipes]
MNTDGTLHIFCEDVGFPELKGMVRKMKKSASNPRKNIALNTGKNAVFTAERDISAFAKESSQFVRNERNNFGMAKEKKEGRRESP